MVIAFAPSPLNPALLQTPDLGWIPSKCAETGNRLLYYAVSSFWYGIFSIFLSTEQVDPKRTHKACPRLSDTISYGIFRMQHHYARPRLHHPSILEVPGMEWSTQHLIRPFMVLRILTCRLEGEMSI